MMLLLARRCSRHVHALTAAAARAGCAAASQRCSLSAAAASPPAAPADEAAIYSSGARATLLADLTVALLGERGRGTVARHSLAAGDLVAAVEPAAVLHGPADAAPEPELLVPLLVQQAAREPRVLAALRCLQGFAADGATQQELPQLSALANLASGSGCCDGSHGHSHGHHSHHTHGHTHPTSSADAGGSSSSQLPPLTLEQAARLVRFNAFGDGYEDLAAAAVRGATEPQSHTGLWPAFALFNHSCTPSTVHYVVGQTMVLRAVEDVQAGREVTISYLGREDFAPAGARQAVLRERFGFTCDCERCRLEAAAPEQLQVLVEQTYARVHQELRPAFMAALEAADSDGVSAAQRGLQELEDALSTALLQDHAAVLSPSAVLVLQAAVYDLFELLLMCEQVVGSGAGQGTPSAAEAAHLVLARLGRCLAICSCVARGSELHVYLASRMLHHAVSFRGAASPQAEAAAALVEEAHLLRYGSALPPQLMMQLMEANKEVAEDLLL